MLLNHMRPKYTNLHCIPTWKIEEILSSPYCQGIDGADYEPVKHELQDILWSRTNKKNENLNEKEYCMTLVLVTEELINQNEVALIDDELPPPIPREALMGWLSNIAIPKSELPKVAPKLNEPKETNAWAALPQGRAITSRPGLGYAPNYRFIYARFSGKCNGCGDQIERGDLIAWFKDRKSVFCPDCEEFTNANADRVANGLPSIMMEIL